MVIFYKKWKKYNEIRLTKNKMDLNIRKMILIITVLTATSGSMPIIVAVRKMTNRPPSPAYGYRKWVTNA